MLQHTNTHVTGFSLIELIIAIAIFGSLCVLSVQTLWDTLSTRAKQYSVENTTSAVRPLFSLLEEAITSASSSSIVSASEIRIIGTTCRTVKLSGTNIVQEMISSFPCVAPTVSPSSQVLNPANFSVSTFTLLPSPYPNTNPKVVSITIGGTYHDGLGTHVFYATTSAVPRVTL